MYFVISPDFWVESKTFFHCFTIYSSFDAIAGILYLIFLKNKLTVIHGKNRFLMFFVFYFLKWKLVQRQIFYWILRTKTPFHKMMQSICGIKHTIECGRYFTLGDLSKIIQTDIFMIFSWRQVKLKRNFGEPSKSGLARAH